MAKQKHMFHQKNVSALHRISVENSKDIRGHTDLAVMKDTETH